MSAILCNTAKRSKNIIIGPLISTPSSNWYITQLYTNIRHYSTRVKKTPNKSINDTISELFSMKEGEKLEWNKIVRRMYEMVAGKYEKPHPTRAHLFIENAYFAVAFVCYYYWLTQLHRYYVDTEIDRNVLQYDEKGKLVRTPEFNEAISVSPSLGYVKALKLEQAMAKLEIELNEIRNLNTALKNMEERQTLLEKQISNVYSIISKDM